MFRLLFSMIFMVALSTNSLAQLKIELKPFAEGLEFPVDIVHADDDKLYVAGVRGKIFIVNADGSVESELFLDITDRVSASASEKGLLGLAFHPDYKENGYFFVNYTTAQEVSRISRFERSATDPSKGDPDTEEVLLQVSQPFNNHNGGDLAFGPDGYIYAGFGDGGSANDPFNNSQTKTKLLGKMLRLDVDSVPYAIPATNPFVNDPGIRDEIWAIGLRNPWRFSFDRTTGDMWIGDVGQRAWEEIDFEPAGSPGGINWGWKCYEGNGVKDLFGCDTITKYTFPIFEYANSKFEDGCSITGGYVYRGTDYPKLSGLYIYTDYCTGKFWALNPMDTTNVEVGEFRLNQYATFGENNSGELFVSAIQEGKIYQIATPINTSNGEVVLNDIKLSVTPNPVQDILNITVEGGQGNESVNYQIVNAQGEMLWDNDRQGSTLINVSSWDSGVYFIRATYDNKRKTLRFVK